jgi:3-oxoacyl-[acyl-carrier protein] reductase
MNKNRNAIIFGSSGSIGLELTNYLLKNNYNTIFTSSNKSKLKKIEKKIKKNIFSKVYGIKCNVLLERDIEKVIKFSKKTFKKIDFVLNCVGVFGYDQIKNLDYKFLNNIFTINSSSLIIINKNIIKHFKNKKDFIKIISIGSSSSKDGFKDTISYCASKHALLGIIKSLNRTIFRNKIVNYCINVGGLNNKMGRGLRSKNYKNLLDQGELVKTLDYISKTGNHGFPEEINIKKFLN